MQVATKTSLMLDNGISLIWMSISTIPLTGDVVKICKVDFAADRYPVRADGRFEQPIQVRCEDERDETAS